jgi:dTDP-4-dehydrorhamnose reductase
MSDPTSKKDITLVVGADGMIGAALLKFLRQSKRNVMGTIFLKEFIGGEHIFLDLAQETKDYPFSDHVTTAYICAGVTQLKTCEQDPNGSARINVSGTLSLIQSLMAKGAFVVFLSSNQVFNGLKPHMEPFESPSPLSEYGKQKAAVEEALKNDLDTVAIVRLTKVLGPNSILSEWYRSLQNQMPIYPFMDMMMSPIALKTVISIISLIGTMRKGGIWQISGEEDISYATAAEWLAEAIKADKKLIHACSTLDSDLYIKKYPPYTTLSTERLRNDFGVEIPPVKWNVYDAFKNYR